jgi:hypothetical protein
MQQSLISAGNNIWELIVAFNTTINHSQCTCMCLMGDHGVHSYTLLHDELNTRISVLVRNKSFYISGMSTARVECCKMGQEKLSKHLDAIKVDGKHGVTLVFTRFKGYTTAWHFELAKFLAGWSPCAPECIDG